MSDYRNLKVWHRTLDFVAQVYQVTNRFPSHEQYGLTSQVRRASTSIVLNIAEGATSGYDKEYGRFIRLAIRSANEVAAGFEIVKRLAYCEPELAEQQIREAHEIAAMLQGLFRSLNRISESRAAYHTARDTLDELDQDFFDNTVSD
jgi:four helix bundle protein